MKIFWGRPISRSLGPTRSLSSRLLTVAGRPVEPPQKQFHALQGGRLAAITALVGRGRGVGGGRLGARPHIFFCVCVGRQGPARESAARRRRRKREERKKWKQARGDRASGGVAGKEVHAQEGRRAGRLGEGGGRGRARGGGARGGRGKRTADRYRKSWSARGEKTLPASARAASTSPRRRPTSRLRRLGPRDRRRRGRPLLFQGPLRPGDPGVGGSAVARLGRWRPRVTGRGVVRKEGGGGERARG